MGEKIRHLSPHIQARHWSVQKPRCVKASSIAKFVGSRWSYPVSAKYWPDSPIPDLLEVIAFEGKEILKWYTIGSSKKAVHRFIGILFSHFAKHFQLYSGYTAVSQSNFCWCELGFRRKDQHIILFMRLVVKSWVFELPVTTILAKFLRKPCLGLGYAHMRGPRFVQLIWFWLPIIVSPCHAPLI